MGVAILCLTTGVVLLAAAPAAWAASVSGRVRAACRSRSSTIVGGVTTVASGGLAATVGQLAAIDASSSGYESLGVGQPDPVSVQALNGGDTLVADATNRLVAEFSPSGSLVWSYTSTDDSTLGAPVSARSLSGDSVTAKGQTGDGYVLICDQGADRVFIVTPRSRSVAVWRRRRYARRRRRSARLADVGGVAPQRRNGIRHRRRR